MSNLFELFGIEDMNSNEPVKRCKGCNAVKSITQFSKNQNTCKGCSSIAWKKYHAENKERLKENYRKYNHEKRTPEQKEYYFRRKEYKKELLVLQEQEKRRCSICNEIKKLDLFPNDFSGKCFFGIKSYCKKCAHEKWRVPRSKTEEYKVKKSIEDKKYRENPRVAQMIRERQKERYYTEIQFKLKLAIRNRINQVLKRKNHKKIDSAVAGLGCSVEDLMTHLEERFHVNPDTGEVMTWENHAKRGWHIDHIKPLSSFNLENEEEFKEACNFKNLQPLWWKENLSKGNKT